jgi:hypothetical protein
LPVNPGANRANKPANIKELKGRTPKPKGRSQREGTNLSGRRTKDDPKVNPNRRRGRRRASKGQPSHDTVLYLHGIATQQFPLRDKRKRIIGPSLDVIVKKNDLHEAVRIIMDRPGYLATLKTQRTKECLRGASFTAVTILVVEHQLWLNELAAEAKAKGESLGDLKLAS